MNIVHAQRLRILQVAQEYSWQRVLQLIEMVVQKETHPNHYKPVGKNANSLTVFNERFFFKRHTQNLQFYDKPFPRSAGMLKIKAFDIFLTAAALAALIFLLPADRHSFNPDPLKIETNGSLLK